MTTYSPELGSSRNRPSRRRVLVVVAVVVGLIVAITHLLTPSNSVHRVDEVTAPPATATPDVPTTVPIPPETVVDAGTGQSWNLVTNSADNFDGNELQNMWSTYSGPGNERVGLRRASAITVANGELAITGKQDVSGGMSQNFGQTYGRWDVRARMDKGAGYGPAILLWPDSERWPTDGELDIVEIPTADRSAAFSASHFGTDNEVLNHSVPGDFSQWHTYSVEWTADHVTFLIDNVATMVIRDRAAIPHKSMHLAIQNDVGAAGHTIPPRNSTTPAAVTLHVDWVKVYQPV